MSFENKSGDDLWPSSSFGEELFLAAETPFHVLTSPSPLIVSFKSKSGKSESEKTNQSDSFQNESTLCCSFGKAQVVRCLLGQVLPPTGPDLSKQNKTQTPTNKTSPNM